MSSTADTTGAAATRTQPKVTETRTFRRNVGLIIRIIITLLALGFALFPVLWIISAAFNPAGSLTSRSLIPQNASLANFQELLASDLFPFWTWTFNSLKIAIISAFLQIMFLALSAYSFSRFRFQGRRTLLLSLLLISVFPTFLMFVALFFLFQQIGNYLPPFSLNTHGALILAYLGGGIGINVWLMKGYFDTIPRDIDESALVDGASHWQIYIRLILPLVRPVLATVGLLSFTGIFTEFVLASVLLKGNDQLTLMVGLYNMVSDNFANNWGIFAAGGLLGAIPTAVLYTILQDQIVGGLTSGAVKG